MTDIMGVFQTPFRCREQAENAFAGESNKRERIREHVPALKSHTTSAGGMKGTNKNQHGGQEETLLARPGTLKNRDAAVFRRIPFPSILLFYFLAVDGNMKFLDLWMR
jgi:hypothetical protein